MVRRINDLCHIFLDYYDFGKTILMVVIDILVLMSLLGRADSFADGVLTFILAGCLLIPLIDIILTIIFGILMVGVSFLTSILDVILDFSEEKNYYDRKRYYYKEQKTDTDNRYTSYNSESDAKKQKAMNLFGFSGAYTEEELKKKRKILAKKAHPDNGGSAEAMTEINDAYELLLSYI